MALDDIPRILQAEVTRDLRPNAAKYAGNNLMAAEPRARLLNGHRRDTSGQNEANRKQRRYFSELTALEYVIVRPLAVLYMEPLLEGHFNQQELLDLIESKRPTFWDRFNKAFKNDRKKGVFGQSLERVVERDGAESTDGVGPGALRVPAVVDSAVSAMRNMDMSVEGVFRKNGNIRRLREMQEEIDAKGCEAVDLTRESPVQVAALLKKFLRDLPDPVLTQKLHKLFITASRKCISRWKIRLTEAGIPDDEKRRRVLHLTCCLLPQAHRDTMEVIFTFLNWVSSFSTVDEESGSKMDIHNLATVIAPNMLHSGSKTLEIENSLLAIEAVHGLIEYNESLCEVRPPTDLYESADRPGAGGHPDGAQRPGPLRGQRRADDQGHPQALRPDRQVGRRHDAVVLRLGVGVAGGAEHAAPGPHAAQRDGGQLLRAAAAGGRNARVRTADARSADGRTRGGAPGTGDAADGRAVGAAARRAAAAAGTGQHQTGRRARADDDGGAAVVDGHGHRDALGHGDAAGREPGLGAAEPRRAAERVPRERVRGRPAGAGAAGHHGRGMRRPGR